MILMHVAYGLDLIALAIGGALLAWSLRNSGNGSMVGKIIGAAVVVLSIVSMVCVYSCASKGECHRSPMGTTMMDQANPEATASEQVKKSEKSEKSEKTEKSEKSEHHH